MIFTNKINRPKDRISDSPKSFFKYKYGAETIIVLQESEVMTRTTPGGLLPFPG